MAIKPNARTSTATARKAAKAAPAKAAKVAPAKAAKVAKPADWQPAQNAKPAQVAKPAASVKAPRNALNIALKGAGKAKREHAFLNIAPLSFVEATSRTETIANLRVALGTKPSADDVKVARSEWIIGRVASRLPTAELPKALADNAARIAFARELVELYAAPAKDGVAARKLRAGQKGRRTIAQQRVVRAAEEAWSQVNAELGHGSAQTQSERNANKRAATMQGATARGKAATQAATQAAAPSHSVLVKPETPKSADDVCEHITMQAAALLAFANKHAALLPMDYGAAVKAFKIAVDKADAERRKNKAIRADIAAA